MIDESLPRWRHGGRRATSRAPARRGRHDVVGLTRTSGKAGDLKAMGAEPAVADALDPDAVMRVVTEARPEVVIHQLTAIPDEVDLRHFDPTSR